MHRGIGWLIIFLLSCQMDMSIALPQQKINIAQIDDLLNAAQLSKLNQAKINLPKTKMITIVIDPGHGGKDSGARGKNGVFEKEVVLQIAKKLADNFKRDRNVRVILTRDDDYFVPLRSRLKLARKGDADFFIAIHADGYQNKEVRGASVYVLSQHGATSEAARWLAEHDQYLELDDINLKTLHDQSLMLRKVLIDLAQTSTIQESLQLGKIVLQQFEKSLQLHHKVVEQAPFVVLKSPDIPSILIETGFITNPKEEARLVDPDYQQQLARSVADAIRIYVRK